MIGHIRASLEEANDALSNLLKNDGTLRSIESGALAMVQSLKSGGTIHSCGNGGSLCDASHFAEELTGRFRKNRPGIAAVAINDPGHLTCVANDFGYEFVFSRYIESVGKEGDVLIALSTSGRSPNVLRAVEAAKVRGITSIGLTGDQGSPLVESADVAVVTPAGRFADRVQELHIKVLHIFIELIERELCPENYKSGA